MAAEAGCHRLLPSLVRHLLTTPGLCVNQANAVGFTALMISCGNKDTACTQLLLAVPDIDVNLADKYGHTGLMHAAVRGHYSTVKLLLAVPGIDVYPRNQSGRSARDFATRKGHKFVVRAIDAFKKDAAKPAPAVLKHTTSRPTALPEEAAAQLLAEERTLFKRIPVEVTTAATIGGGAGGGANAMGGPSGDGGGGKDDKAQLLSILDGDPAKKQRLEITFNRLLKPPIIYASLAGNGEPLSAV